MDALLVSPAQLGRDRVTPEHRVDRVRDVRVDQHPLAVLDLDDDVERRRGLALQHALLGAAAAGLFVAERDALDPADEIGRASCRERVSLNV